MSQPAHAPEPLTRNRTFTLWVIAGTVIISIVIVLSFTYFFNFSANNWTPVPTYTATFNGTQALHATNITGSLTPPATATITRTRGPATQTPVPAVNQTNVPTGAGITVTPSPSLEATITSTATPDSTAAPATTAGGQPLGEPTLNVTNAAPNTPAPEATR